LKPLPLGNNEGVFENRVLRRTFKTHREDNGREQHNQELQNLYFSPDIKVVETGVM
jgi:hypothetical protein